MTVPPSFDTKNFVKFHFIASVPSTPFALSLRYSYSGSASLPFTFVFSLLEM